MVGGGSSYLVSFCAIPVYSISHSNGTKEGLLTCCVAILFYFLICDFPEDVKWLNDEERAFIKAKLARDVGEADRESKMTWRDVVEVLKDCKFDPFLFCCTPEYGY